MKKALVVLILIAATSIGASAQQIANPYPKTITVTGSAEMEIIPDEIYVQVDLKEYEKKGVGKVNIEKIKTEFLQNARAVGIADSNVTIAAYDGYDPNPWYRKKNRKTDLYASITYQLKIKSSKQMDDLVNKLDDLATANFYIQRTSHSKIQEFRKQLKIQAVKAAKDKAQYLAAAADESIGVAVTIMEPVEYGHYPVYNRAPSNQMMRTEAATGQVAGDMGNQPDFNKIKFKYDVTVVFSLK